MMTKFIAVFDKEWRLLWRDKLGLIFLFILPMCLVLFITLTSSVDDNKPRQLKLLLINEDPKGEASKAIIKSLNSVDNFKMSQSLDQKTTLTLNDAKRAVGAGDYQALIIIPAQFSKQIAGKMRHLTVADDSRLTVLFDPALPKNFQQQLTSTLRLLVQSIELQWWRQTASPLIDIQIDYVHSNPSLSFVQPNDVQQNVPAWALFGMFFIITPLSGMIVKERRLGVMDRLWLSPISLYTLIWGKISAFVCINLLQLVLMLIVGVFILPWFGLPTLDVASSPGSIFVVGLAASLAATGFGMLIGSLVKTPEQATVIGPFIIVILAAIGGIFVPVYLLPEGLKNISQFSPLYWALQSFIDIFVRHATLSELWPNIAKLLIFALATITLAFLILRRSRL